MTDEATEETALLQDAPVAPLPLLRDYLLRLDSVSPDNLGQDDLLCCPQLSNQRARYASFSLLLLLLFREKKTRKKISQNNTWDQWKQETQLEQWVKAIDQNIVRIWNGFLSEFCSAQDIEIILWTEFRIDGKGKPYRVIDFVTKHPDLLNDRVIELSLKNRWRRGPPLDSSNTRRYLTPRYDMLCTPWIYHAFDFGSQVAFLILLVLYVLDPPRPAFYSLPLESIGSREIILIVISISAILHSWPTSVPFALTLLAFIVKLPSTPLPSDFAFNLLLLSLALLLIQLYLPFPPNPFLLFRPDLSLPLAVLIVNRVFGTILKVVSFFLPILLLSVVFLSVALSDVFLLIDLAPAPMQTRELFLILAVSNFILMVLAVLVLVSTSTFSRETKSPWDRYSIAIGRRARIEFYNSVIQYSKPYPFPPPFNILYFVLISIPTYVLPHFDISTSFFFALQKNLWRIIVGPFVAVARLFTFNLP
ncbi:hypothetical protein C8R42DRAFT_722406 [Lentinula raphanica]|nr:hypothetical protein C8R42DRAFT_722406 [Lentinula raphanica]